MHKLNIRHSCNNQEYLLDLLKGFFVAKNFGDFIIMNKQKLMNKLYEN